MFKKHTRGNASNNIKNGGQCICTKTESASKCHDTLHIKMQAIKSAVQYRYV